MNARHHALTILMQLKKDKVSLNEPLRRLDAEQKALVSELCLGVCRYYHLLLAIVNSFLDKPLKKKDLDLQLALVLGLYQLRFTELAEHAVLNETVDLATQLGKPWAKGLINACLRRYLRECDELDLNAFNEPEKFSHPQWLYERLKKAWPDQYQNIMNENNQRAPMSLRVNQQKVTRQAYLEKLAALGIEGTVEAGCADGIILAKPTMVTELADFFDGYCSVQDLAAQLAADFMALAPNLRVLDACCAPGGKTCHMLEREPSLVMSALDSDEKRIDKVKENLSRLGLSATLLNADGRDVSAWWDGNPFDRILLDAPCSATGVIRRHPDIKLLRTSQDVTQIAAIQSTLLNALWPLLAVGGRLVYATCSVLPTENEQQIAAFVDTHQDASVVDLACDWGIKQPYGRQLLPKAEHDGFYYAALEKS